MSDACSSCRGSGVVHCEPCVACSGRGAPETELATLRARISTLEARIAELERARDDQGEVIRQQETECMRRVARNATLASDYREAEARVAELAREMGAMAAALKEAVATNEELRAERDEAAKLLGTVVCIGTLMEGEELVTDPRHAATGAILGWRSAAFAARAERDEAVGLLERVDDHVDFATGWDEGSRDHNDVLNDVRAWRLARVAAPAPDKEPTP